MRSAKKRLGVNLTVNGNVYVINVSGQFGCDFLDVSKNKFANGTACVLNE